MRVETGFGGQCIIDYYLHAAAQFEYTTGDNALANLQTIDNIDKITTCLSQTNKLLAQHFFSLTGLFVFLLFYHKDRISKGGIRNCGCSDR